MNFLEICGILFWIGLIIFIGYCVYMIGTSLPWVDNNDIE